MNSEKKESDKHFHMSSDYERHSSSQKLIGHLVITEFLKEFTKHGFSTYIKPEDLNDFYTLIKNKLSKIYTL